MSIVRPRNRLVYFRVSEDEFQQFSQMCESAGARSISDLARSAVQRMIKEDNHYAEDDMAEKLKALEVIVCELNRKLQQLTVLLAGRIGEETPSIRPAAVTVAVEENGRCG